MLNDVVAFVLLASKRSGGDEGLIPQHTPIPVSKSDVFSNLGAEPVAWNCNVLQGERQMAPETSSLGRFPLSGDPPAPRGCRSAGLVRTSMPTACCRAVGHGSNHGPQQSVIDQGSNLNVRKRLSRLLERPPSRRDGSPQALQVGSAYKPCPDPGHPGRASVAGRALRLGPMERSATAAVELALHGCAGPAQRNDPVEIGPWRQPAAGALYGPQPSPCDGAQIRIGPLQGIKNSPCRSG